MNISIASVRFGWKADISLTWLIAGFGAADFYCDLGPLVCSFSTDAPQVSFRLFSHLKQDRGHVLVSCECGKLPTLRDARLNDVDCFPVHRLPNA